MAHYKYKEIKTEGFNGTTLTFFKKEEDKSIYLGEYQGYHYLYADNDYEPKEQLKEIDFQKVESLTNEEILALEKGPYINRLKEDLRDTLNKNVGDLLDQLANISKLVEFGTFLSAALAAHISKVKPLTNEKLQEYGNRAKVFLEAEANGDVVIRGQFDKPDEMMLKAMQMYSKTNTYIKPYIEEKKRVLK